MLVEYAGDCLPSLAAAIGGQAFAPYFAGLLPLLLKKIVSKGYFFSSGSIILVCL